ncbi:maleylpyruvate isomerase family mycothiol-dependent enzyme [Pimelobacter sp. 30-1]|uniref:maleylpyruvate isomerase family mycothiol-dependent enzyme n=1 Tax=Pimelobacter sp. 30-1 TaxID=2004991 RepID=UPI001C050EB0|nr:maleylpyruvate isomerase family mycothiol-dependent enzyme [Pimelobacter sp. 30-1]MBU2695496.1 hypothetical protein [Pimelobacter sp. 30-1]
MKDVWTWVHAERAALVADLAEVDAARWETPSLCPGWSVHDVVAHLIDNARTTRLGIVRAMVRARFDFDRQNADGVRRERGATPAETLDRLRAVVTRTTTPPAPLDSRLVEEVVHGEDVRRPLGITHTYAPTAVERALHYQARTSVSMGGAKQRIAGLRLEATDAELALGEAGGTVVRGPAVALLLAASGRTAALDDLSGAGVDALR